MSLPGLHSNTFKNLKIFTQLWKVISTNKENLICNKTKKVIKTGTTTDVVV